MLAQDCHTNTLYCEDNASLYYALKEATLSTSYAASIKPYQIRKYVRGAWTSIAIQYIGVEKWDADLKK